MRFACLKPTGAVEIEHAIMQVRAMAAEYIAPLELCNGAFLLCAVRHRRVVGKIPKGQARRDGAACED